MNPDLARALLFLVLVGVVWLLYGTPRRGRQVSERRAPLRFDPNCDDNQVTPEERQ